MDARIETKVTQEREARQMHGLWQLLAALDNWISGKVRDVWQWISTRSPAVLKLIWITFCLGFGPLGALLSPVLLVVAGLVFLLSLLMLLGRLLRGQSLENWKFVAAVSLGVMAPMLEMTTILYDPAGAVDLLGLNQ